MGNISSIYDNNTLIAFNSIFITKHEKRYFLNYYENVNMAFIWRSKNYLFHRELNKKL